MRIDVRSSSLAGPPDASHYRALLDGEDVTSQCFLADDQMGVVGVYLRDATGHFYRDEQTGDAAQEFRRGEVTLIPPDPAAESVAEPSKEKITA